MKKIALTVILLSCGYSFAFAQAVFGPNSNTTYCTQDVYVCPNGQTVGRTGTNCEFVCSPVLTYCGLPNNNAYTGCLAPSVPSYTYTSGCYTYYYNSTTRTTTVISYNCQSNTWNNYYPFSNYGVYFYNNGIWAYSNNQNNYWNNHNYQNYTPYYGNNCYYQNGYRVCY